MPAIHWELPEATKPVWPGKPGRALGVDLPPGNCFQV